MVEERRLKTAVVGLGGIFYGWGGDTGFAPHFPKIDEIQLSAVCDIRVERVERAIEHLKRCYETEIIFRKERGERRVEDRLREDISTLKGYTSFEQMLDEEEIELLIILAPVKWHKPYTIMALERGINVMCEKPMARTYLEALEMAEAVSKSGKLFHYNENYIYTLKWYNVRKFITSGIIGEIVAIFYPLAIGEPGLPVSSYWSVDLGGGGSLIDFGVHGITTSWFLLGFDAVPRRVKSAEPDGISIKMPERLIDYRFQRATAEDDAHILVEFERDNGWTTVFVEASWSYGDSYPEPIIMGTKGMTKVDEQGVRIIDRYGKENRIDFWRSEFLTQPFLYPETGGYLSEMKAMAQAILRGEKPLCDERIGLETMAIVEACYLSEKRGRKEVELKEFKSYAEKLREKYGDKASEVLLEELRIYGR